MRIKRARNKTATMTLRVDPRIKAAAERAAELDRRSVTSLIEVLILKHCEHLDLDPKTRSSKEIAR